MNVEQMLVSVDPFTGFYGEVPNSEVPGSGVEAVSVTEGPE